MNNFIEKIVLDEIKKLSLKEKMTGALVKNKRGTYQALAECGVFESEIIKDMTDYIKSWFKNELLDGEIKNKFLKELYQQIQLDLVKRGFLNISLKK